jgi:hypothetical protein
LDSTKVYVYQTEKTHSGSDTNQDFEYPNYIELRPEYLLTNDAENFISFLENNNDLYGIFSDNSVQPIIYLASQTDTIKNIGLNQLWEKLEKKQIQSSLLYSMNYRRRKHCTFI